jgi:phosphodiesterase/alkaline phosphatase D-like protein
MRLSLFLLSFYCSLLLFSQTLTHGPVVGSVYPNAAKIYYRTDLPARLTVECDSNPSFSNPLIFSDSATSIDNSVLIQLENLQPNTTYYYRVR